MSALGPGFYLPRGLGFRGTFGVGGLHDCRCAGSAGIVAPNGRDGVGGDVLGRSAASNLGLNMVEVSHNPSDWELC